MFAKSRVVLVAVVVTAAMVGGAPGAGASAAPASAGSRRYIVALATAFRPAGTLGKAAAVQDRSIAAASAVVQRAVLARGGRVVRTYRHVPALVAVLDDGQLAAVRRDRNVASVVPDGVEAAADAPATPVTPPTGRARPAVNPPWPLNGNGIIGSDTGNSVGVDGQGQTIAIIDSGVDATHPYLSGRVVDEACFATNTDSSGACPNGDTVDTGPGSGAPCSGSTDCDHGTHVAGIAAGANGTYGSYTLNGVAPKARIEPIQVFHIVTSATTCTNATKVAPCALTNDSDVIAALDYVYNNRGASHYAAINMSLGGTTTYTSACDSVDQTEADAVDNLYSVGILTAIASGNGSATNGVSFPGCITHAVAVGATSNNDNTGGAGDTIASFSNMGVPVDVLAPGVNVLSSVPGGGFANKSGTSMATPEVAGAIADLRQAVPNGSALFVLNALNNSSTGTEITDTRTGGLYQKPRINLYNAYESHSIGGDDAVAGATNLSGSSGTISGCSTAPSGTADSPIYFTKVAGEPNHAGNRGGASAWFKFLALGSGTASIDTIGSGYDTLLAAYDSNDLTTPVASNDDTNGLLQSAVSFAMVAGHTYDMALDGYRSSAATVGATGPCVIHWSLSITRPPNDDEVNATTLSGAAGTVYGSNSQATFETGELSFEGSLPKASVWWKWTAPESGSVHISTAGSDIPTRVAVYVGVPPTTNQALVTSGNFYGNSTQSLVGFFAVQGLTYYIDVDTYQQVLHTIPQGTIRLQWGVNYQANDNLANATLLSGVEGRTYGDNSRATGEPGEPTLYGLSDPLVTNWYEYVPNASGNLTVNVIDGNFDSFVGVYTGADVADLALVGANDDYYSQTLLSGLTVPVTSGTPYWIQVDGAPVAGSPGGTYTLQWGLNPPPNDSFFAPQTLNGANGVVAGDNTHATSEPTEGDTRPPDAPIGTVWYSWIAPTTDTVTFSTGGSNFDTAMAVWAGNIGGLGRVAADDNSAPDGTGALVSLAVTAGTRYLISVDGVNGAIGTVWLGWREGPTGKANVNVLDTTVGRPGSGTVKALFTITIDGPLSKALKLTVSTVDGTATTPRDYFGLTAQTVNIPAGMTSVTVGVKVKARASAPPGRTFSLVVTLTHGKAVIVDGSATATIT